MQIFAAQQTLPGPGGHLKHVVQVLPADRLCKYCCRIHPSPPGMITKHREEKQPHWLCKSHSSHPDNSANILAGVKPEMPRVLAEQPGCRIAQRASARADPVPRALQAKNQAVQSLAALLLPCSAPQMLWQGGSATATPPEQALRIKAAEVSAWLLARHSSEFVAPLHPSAWLVPPPTSRPGQLQAEQAHAISVPYGQQWWGWTDCCLCASAVGKVPGSLSFLTVGKSLLHILWRCPALPEHAQARRRNRSAPPAGRETEAGSTPGRSKERLGMKHLVPLQCMGLAWRCSAPLNLPSTRH